MKSILITGAGGFIGGFLVEEALKRGYDTWAAVRSTTSREYLKDKRIHFIELDYDDQDNLEKTLSEHNAECGRWDYIVHNLGVTKSTNYLNFERVNHGYLRTLVDALQATDMTPEVFLLMSSLSVMGPGEEKSYKPFLSTDIPQPNTFYGLSKVKAETYLQMVEKFPYTIFRCTGVYGPREKDYFLMIKSIKRGFDFSVGFEKQMLTFIYVKDLVTAVMDALERGPLRKAYFISERGIGQEICHSRDVPLVVGQGGLPSLGIYRQGHTKGKHPQPRQVQDSQAAQLAVRHQRSPSRLRLLPQVFTA